MLKKSPWWDRKIGGEKSVQNVPGVQRRERLWSKKEKLRGKLHIGGCWKVSCSCRAVEAAGGEERREGQISDGSHFIHTYTYKYIPVCVLYT